jgi:hypothetical protein
MKAGNHGLLLIDTGFRADDILTARCAISASPPRRLTDHALPSEL